MPVIDELINSPLPASIVIAAVGFAILLSAFIVARRSVAPANWPSVVGTITYLHLHKKVWSDGTTYEVKVEYCYSVMDRTYNGSRLAFGYHYSEYRRAHQGIFNKLEHASSVRVRYNPRNPAISTLSFGIHRTVEVLLALSVMWILLAVPFAAPWLAEQLPFLEAVFVFASMLKAAAILLGGFFLFKWIESRPDDVIARNIEVVQKRAL